MTKDGRGHVQLEPLLGILFMGAGILAGVGALSMMTSRDPIPDQERAEMACEQAFMKLLSMPFDEMIRTGNREGGIPVEPELSKKGWVGDYEIKREGERARIKVRVWRDGTEISLSTLRGS